MPQDANRCMGSQEYPLPGGGRYGGCDPANSAPPRALVAEGSLAGNHADSMDSGGTRHVTGEAPGAPKNQAVENVDKGKCVA